MNSHKMNENILKISEVNKPLIDKKEYRYISLKNGMEVILISDPDTDKSAAAMNINIGSLSDPRELLGLAHFCEHMVFMGSSKYPAENYYAKYLSQNNGEYNAYTSYEDTNFYFEIKPENLSEAIDIFAQFFISPLLTESATDRELQAVNSEHEKNICDDFCRLVQLERYLCDKGHDYNKFSYGNIKTLKEDPELNHINVREELLKFHSRFYSSNIMSLCVLSKESLDELQDLTIELFSKVLNKNVEVPFWENHPWTEEYLKQIVYVTPVRECYEIFLSWPTPDYKKLYLSKPHHYVCHLLGHEGPGSILALLKKKGWANKLSVGPNYIGNGFASLNVSIELFEEGINHVDEIVTIIYQYIAILKSQEPQEWIFNEEKNLKEMHFQFRESSNLKGLVSQICREMRIYDAEHILEGPYIMKEFKPNLIKNIIDGLVPTQMNMFCVAKKFESTCNLEECHYKTKYEVKYMTEDQLKSWTNVEPNKALFLPGPNPYVPTNFMIKSSNEDVEFGPELIRDNNFCRWWFNQDTHFRLPKGFIYISLYNTLSLRDPVSMAMNYMIVDLFLDAINEDIYDAELANLRFKMFGIYNGLKMQFTGYNDKILVYVTDIFKKLVKFIPDDVKFESIKENKFRSIKHFFTDSPLYQADTLLSCLMAEVMWTPEDLLSTQNEITLENFTVYFKNFFSQFYIEGLIYGNFKCNEALNVVNDIEKIFSVNFPVKPLLKSQFFINREILIPENSNYVFHYSNIHQPTSAIITYLQGKEQTCRNNIILRLSNNILEEPVFNQLRTVEQLGYIVGCGIKLSNSMQGQRIYLQSVKNPSELDDRVNKFLISFNSVLQTMSEDEFNKYVQSLKNRLLERPKDMSKQGYKYWSEIFCRHYNFNRNQEEADELVKLTKEDIIEYFNKFNHPESTNLKKLSIYVTSELTHGKYSLEKCDSKISVIDDIVKFKKSLPLSSLIESVVPHVKDMPTAKL